MWEILYLYLYFPSEFSCPCAGDDVHVQLLSIWLSLRPKMQKQMKKKHRPDQKPIILINCQSKRISRLRPRLMATSMQQNTQAPTSDMWPEKRGRNQWSLITSNRKFMILYLQPNE